jgi:hypothetical protein
LTPPPPSRRLLSAAPALWLGLGLLSLSACGSGLTDPSNSSEARRCAVPPSPVTPAAVELPMSELGVTVSIDVPAFLDALHRELPVVVAEAERRPIGTAGLVSYSIRRSRLALTQNQTTLALSTTLNGEVHVCKPFAGACIPYGVCEPRWEVTGKLTREFNTLTELLPELDVKLTKGCTLRPVGYNASSILLQNTERETAKIRARLEQAFGAWLGKIDAVWRGINDADASPWRLESAAAGFYYRPLSLTDDTLSGAVTWRGHLFAQAGALPAAIQVSESAPPLALSNATWHRQKSLPTKTRWISGSALPYDTLLQQLNTAWQRHPGGDTRPVKLVTSEHDGQAVLVVGLPANAGCASNWLTVTPTLVTGTSAAAPSGLVLKPATPPSSQPLDAAARWLSSQTFEWTAQPELAPGAARELARRSFEELSLALKPQLRAASLLLDVAPPTETHTLHLGPTGLTLVTAVDTDIQLKFAP